MGTRSRAACRSCSSNFGHNARYDVGRGLPTRGCVETCQRAGLPSGEAAIEGANQPAKTTTTTTKVGSVNAIPVEKLGRESPQLPHWLRPSISYQGTRASRIYLLCGVKYLSLKWAGMTNPDWAPTLSEPEGTNTQTNELHHPQIEH